MTVEATDRLRPTFSVWGLFWRFVLAIVGNLLIIPAPWTQSAYWGYMCRQIALPDGRQLTFGGRAGDIWYIFIAAAISGQALRISNIVHVALMYKYGIMVAQLIIGVILMIYIIRWLCASMGVRGGHLNIVFTGSIFGFVWRYALAIVSILTIIGWAWAEAYFLRWVFKNITGTHQFEFHGTGVNILWRTLVLFVLCILVIPAPWAMRWFMAWMVSQTGITASPQLQVQAVG